MIRLAPFMTMLLLIVWLTTSSATGQQSLRFEVSLDPKLATEPISGRLYLFLTTDPQKPPMRGGSWSKPEPMLGADVQGWLPGASQILDDQADCFPLPISQLPPGKYRLQAVLDQDIYFPHPSQGPGNFFSQVVDLDWTNPKEATIKLPLTEIVPPLELADTDRVKFIQQKSQRLSEHYGREVIDRVGIILPESYETQPDRRYPVYYEITGFGGNLRGVGRRGPNRRNTPEGEVEFIRVILTGECKDGHHVYANSAKNGPRGDALVEEMIPHIDANFRTIPDPRARFVGGHSSGGWSSLWLQVTYPTIFGGCFSSSPDPVDFRDFQGTNLYAEPPQSLYVDAAGNRRPLARNGQQVTIWYDDFARMDHAMKRGGQLKSFEAVFSPLDSKGNPAAAWDWSTGYVHPEVIEHWKKYDIRLQIESQWGTLRPQLAGKIHIVMGELDTFYLEGATHRLADTLRELGSDASIEFIPNASHSLPPEARAKLSEAMKQSFLKSFHADGTPRS